MIWKATRSRWRSSRPALSEGTRVYAVGDIHGRLDLLKSKLRSIRDDIARRPIARPIQVFLGDYVDRGPASREVLDLLSTEVHKCETVFLRGNHEVYLLEFLKDPTILDEWRRFGGLETLLSYSMTPTAEPGASEQAE